MWSFPTQEAEDDKTYYEAHINYELLEKEVRADLAQLEAEYPADIGHAQNTSESAAAADLGVTLPSYEHDFEEDLANFTTAEEFRMDELMFQFGGSSFEDALAESNFRSYDFTQDQFSEEN